MFLTIVQLYFFYKLTEYVNEKFEDFNPLNIKLLKFKVILCFRH